MIGNIENLLNLTSDLFRKNEMKPLLQQVAGVAQWLCDRGWAERNAGNFSVNVTGLMHEKDVDRFSSSPFIPLTRSYPDLARNILLVSGAGTRMRDMAAGPAANLCFVFISDTGSACHIIGHHHEGDPVKPTSELVSHLAIQQQFIRKKAPEKVILHAHVTELIALTQLAPFKSEEAINRLLRGMHPEIVLYEPAGAGFVPYMLAGTEHIASATLGKLEHFRAVIWEKHGCLATGTSLPAAFDTLDIFAKAAKIYFLAKSSGLEPEGLTEEQIREIYPL
jgi:rhamnulose-1-phosphate aldolase